MRLALLFQRFSQTGNRGAKIDEIGAFRLLLPRICVVLLGLDLRHDPLDRSLFFVQQSFYFFPEVLCRGKRPGKKIPDFVDPHPDEPVSLAEYLYGERGNPRERGKEGVIIGWRRDENMAGDILAARCFRCKEYLSLGYVVAQHVSGVARRRHDLNGYAVQIYGLPLAHNDINVERLERLVDQLRPIAVIALGDKVGRLSGKASLINP